MRIFSEISLHCMLTLPEAKKCFDNHTGTIGYPNFKKDNKNNNTRHICRNNVL